MGTILHQKRFVSGSEYTVHSTVGYFRSRGSCITIECGPYTCTVPSTHGVFGSLRCTQILSPRQKASHKCLFANRCASLYFPFVELIVESYSEQMNWAWRMDRPRT